jgi:hypothetical protein
MEEVKDYKKKTFVFAKIQNKKARVGMGHT